LFGLSEKAGPLILTIANGDTPYDED